MTKVYILFICLLGLFSYSLGFKFSEKISKVTQLQIDPNTNLPTAKIPTRENIRTYLLEDAGRTLNFFVVDVVNGTINNKQVIVETTGHPLTTIKFPPTITDFCDFIGFVGVAAQVKLYVGAREIYSDQATCKLYEASIDTTSPTSTEFKLTGDHNVLDFIHHGPLVASTDLYIAVKTATSNSSILHLNTTSLEYFDLKECTHSEVSLPFSNVQKGTV
jgi:hypothetical protein